MSEQKGIIQNTLATEFICDLTNIVVYDAETTANLTQHLKQEQNEKKKQDTAQLGIF